MFAKFSEFWIRNPILTAIFILLSVLGGAVSWFAIPKQYNPDISAPTYHVTLAAPGYGAREISEYVVKPTEAKLREMEGVEHVYSVSARDYGAITVSFYAGTDVEKAVTRLTNKLMTQIDTKPSWVSDPVIKSIDSNDIPIYTFAIVDPEGADDDATRMRLKKAARDVIDRLADVPNVSTVYQVGGENDSVIVTVDPDKLEAKGVDMLQALAAVKAAGVRMPWGDFTRDGTKNVVAVSGELGDLAKLGSVVVGSRNGASVLLEDVAEISRGVVERRSDTYHDFGNGPVPAAFVAVAKKKGSNAVTVVDALKTRLDALRPGLGGLEIRDVQDEGEVASKSTSGLFHELVNTVVILFFILLLFLGFKDAASSAVSVPIVLALTFVFAYVTGDNINKITLFALILALGMLVDDSIIVVENVSRHLAHRKKNETVLATILKSVDEIGFAAFFSTITKIVAFVGLFFVTGMLGQYMGPIPKYLIVSLVISIFVAFTVNPALAYWIESRREKRGLPPIGHGKAGKSRLIRRYEALLAYFLDSAKRRKALKIGFFATLAVLFTLPGFELVKMRLLPKSDKDAVYVWIDLPRNSSIEKTEEAAKEVDAFFRERFRKSSLKRGASGNDANIVTSVTAAVGTAPTLDFATVARWGASRIKEYQASFRINLVPAEERELSSEGFVLAMRPLLEERLKKYPGIKTRFLEDPPGPPVKATFLLKVSGDPGESRANVERFALWLKTKILPILEYHDVLDLYDSSATYQNRVSVVLKPELLAYSGISPEYAAQAVRSVFSPMEAGVYRDDASKEPETIYVRLPRDRRDDPKTLDSLMLTSETGKKVPLSEVAEITIDRNDDPIVRDDQLPTTEIYGEMGDNSVMYPMANLIKRFVSEDFWEGKYELTDWNLYRIDVREKSTGKTFSVRLAGEWEMTIDSFRDLGIALGATLTLLYFLVAANFRSFKMGGVIMLSFLLGFFGFFPGFALLYLFGNVYMSATSMIGVISLSGIVIGNGIIFFDYYVQLRKEGMPNKEALVRAGSTRMTPILLTSSTAILGAAMIASDPVWSGLSWALIWGLSASATLMLLVVPVFAYDAYEGVEFGPAKDA